MTEHSSDRRAELIAGALSEDLSADERQELETMMRSDPNIVIEMNELGVTAHNLKEAGPDAGSWLDDQPSPQLRERVMAATQAPETEESPEVSDLQARRVAREPESRRRSPQYLLAAAGLVAGVLITTAGYQIAATPPSGPPGTLGAVEEVELVGEPADVEIDGALIAHTWGTETVLEVDGLEVGEGYAVVLVSDDGAEFDSGSFLGSEVLIECRMNAAIMREDVVRLEIRHEDGDVVTGADLPDAVES